MRLLAAKRAATRLHHFQPLDLGAALFTVHKDSSQHHASPWQGGPLRTLTQQAGLDKVRLIFQEYVMIAALKAAIAHYAGDPAWLTLRPPLVELAPSARESLANRLEAAGFSMPGLSSTVSA